MTNSASGFGGYRLCRREKGSYVNSAGTEKWLVGDSSIDIASAAHCWSAAINDLWPQAADVIRTGRRPYKFYDWVEEKPDLSAAFQRLNLTGVELDGRDIADKLDLITSTSRLLDVGGGHGMFSVILCPVTQTSKQRFWTARPR